MKKKVFISYSSKDISIVRFFVETLEKNEVECWFSDNNINPLENWAAVILGAMKTCDYVLVIISDSSVSSGQVLNEVQLASNLNKAKIPIRLSNTPLTEELAYHLSLHAIEYYKMTDDVFFNLLFKKMNICTVPESIVKETAKITHEMLENMLKHSSDIFTNVQRQGGFSWGENKSVIQNLDGGWLTGNVVIENYDDEKYKIPSEYMKEYEEYFESPEFQQMLQRGQNLLRIMLTGFTAFQNKLFLSLKKTEWSHVMFFWKRVFKDYEKRKVAIDAFFVNEATGFPNSLCLHMIVIDSNDCIVATKINSRKKNDYPSTIAVTLGEQIDESDLSVDTHEDCILYWMRRAMIEEFGFTEEEYHYYVNEGTARIMALNVEADIFNLSLVCCVKITCSCEELAEYYAMHRSMNDEFNEVFPITLSETKKILENSNENASNYHPSSFLRLLYGYIYTSRKLPWQ